MCGRFTLATPADELKKHFNLFTLPELVAHYNITPSAWIATVHEAEGGRLLEPLRWGLIPRWAKDGKIGAKLANARAESVHEKPAFKQAFRRRRCLVPADGYYEWKKVPGGKQPWFFHREGRSPFALAAIWESWDDPESGEEIRTCALLTTEPNTLAAQVHDRMPVILPEESWGIWLDPKAGEGALRGLLAPYPGDDLRAHPVSKRVNSPMNDDALCTAPLDDDGATPV